MLYIVATPIGNLEDISLRALRILKEADLILCEDTRQTKKLLERYNIHTPLLSYHQHSKFRKIERISDLLRRNKTLALVSDAGTPGISDPGNQLISHLVARFSEGQNTQAPNCPSAQPAIVPIPGPSAVTAALSISGLPTDKFIFLGFSPQKRGRQRFFNKVAGARHTVIFYESPYRILKTLGELDRLPELSNREVVVCRELTKKFETVYRGKISQILGILEKEKIKGEFVVIIAGKARAPSACN